MKLVIQRVTRASVSIENKEIGSIKKGLLVFVGVEQEDAEDDINYLVKKLINIRIFEDQSGKMNLSIQDVKGSLLIISQFTLLANCKKGNRPSFMGAGSPNYSKQLYLKFIQDCQKQGVPTEQGEFGAHMDISLVNEGPVTILLDSKLR